MGFGLMYLPAIVMVGYYFEKRRAFATGVAVCGSGIGGFVFAPMCRYLVSEYGWQGATWIIAGICLNGIVIGALFRPLEAHSRRNRTISTASQPQQQTDVIVSCAPVGDTTSAAPDVICTYSLQDLSHSKQASKASSKSMDNLHRRLMTHDKPHHHNWASDVNNPLNRKDIFYSGSIQNIPEFKESPDVETYVRQTTKVPEDSSNDEVSNQQGQGCCSMLAGIKKTMDISLLADPVFLIYGISCFLCMAGMYKLHAFTRNILL